MVFARHRSCVHRRSAVEASLLAMGLADSTSPLTDTPPSRAASLPQGIWGVRQSRIRQQSTVGASLLAMTAADSTLPLTDAPLSPASRLLQWFLPGTGLVFTADPLWKPACWRWGWHNQPLLCLTHRPREQARFHSFRPASTSTRPDDPVWPGHRSRRCVRRR